MDLLMPTGRPFGLFSGLIATSYGQLDAFLNKSGHVSTAMVTVCTIKEAAWLRVEVSPRALIENSFILWS